MSKGRAGAWRHWLSISLLLLGAAGWSLAPALLGFRGSVALIVGAGAAALVELFGILRDRYVRRRNLRSVVAKVHRDVRRIDPALDLGMRRSTIPSEVHGRSWGFPPYVPGEIDRRLDGALAETDFVLVTGDALTGKTRAAFEAVGRLRPRASLVAPEDTDGLRRLLELDPPLLDTWRPVVVWLDDLRRFSGIRPEAIDAEPFGGSASVLSGALFARHLGSRAPRFLGRRVRVVFVATMSTREYDFLTKGGEVVSRGATAFSLAAVARLARRVRLDAGDAAGWDLETARRLYPGVDFSPGVGRALAEFELLVNAYRYGMDDLSHAVIQACVDWRRIGAGDPTEEQLDRLARAYLPGAIISSEEIEAALHRANREVSSGQRLISRVGDQDELRLRAHEFLLDADEGYATESSRRPVDAAAWGVAIACLSKPELLAVAEAAVARHQLDVADEIWDELLASEEAGLEVRAAVYVDRAEAHSEDSPERAKGDLEVVIALEAAPAATVAAAYQARGGLSLNDKVYADAEADFTRALAITTADDETRARALANRGALRFELGRPDEAELDFQAALSVPGASGNPRSQALAIRGIVHLNRNDFDAAYRDCDAALSQQGARPFARAYAHLGRAEVADRRQWHEQAESDFIAAVEISCGFDSQAFAALFLVKRGRFLCGHGRHADAEQDFERVLAIEAIDADMRAEAYVGRALSRELDRTPAAVEDCTAALEVPGAGATPRAEAYFIRGRLRTVLGEFAAAERDLTTAVEYPGAVATGRAVALLSRGINFYRQRTRMDEAEADFSAVIEFDGAEEDTRALAHYDRGLIRRKRRLWALAEADFRESLKVPHEGTELALKELTDLLRLTGRVGDEIAFYEDVVAGGREDLVPFAMARLEVYEERKSRRSSRRLRGE